MIIRFALLAGLSLAAALTSVVADDGEFRTQFSNNQLQWLPDAAYGGAALTLVRPDGQAVTQNFAPGQAITLDLARQASAPGQYLYELTLLPELSAAQETALQQARDSGQSPSFSATATRQQGAFRNEGGQWLGADLGQATIEERPGDDESIQDQVINDDLIVTFSACVGSDCVNGESFGFDTVRLKENNLRLHFDDTSDSASFPANDWRLVANDTGNGGANYFGIEDSTAGRIPFRVEAGAPANSLWVDDAGNIGVGTPTPVVEMHIRDGDSPTLRLEQDGSSGFGSQTWDLAGNETNFFVRDVTNGSRLPFKIKPGAPENSLFIAADGDIGLGTQSPAARLHVQSGNVYVIDNVGLGTTTPAGQLHVATGNAVFDNNVGIGTTSPSVPLQVVGGVTGLEGDVGVGTSAPTSRLHVTGGDVRMDGNAGIGVVAPQGRLHVGDGDALFEGAVGIGTLTPSADLQVVGSTVALEANVGVGTNSPQARLHVAQGNVYVEGSTGLGTSSPQARLHVAGGNAVVENSLGIGTTIPQVALDVASGNAAFAGSVGIGTVSPQASLHVATGSVRVDNDLAVGVVTPAGRLHVAGGNAVIEGNVGVGTTSPAARLHVAGGDLRVDGNVGIGTATPEARLHVSGGDLRVDGAVYQLSSRAAKTNLTAMDAGRVLDLLSSLDLFNWTYSDSADQGRHFGPTAEDFYALFGLGETDRHISVADMAGVALGAAQALQQELVEKDRELEDVKARLARLERLLEASDEN